MVKETKPPLLSCTGRPTAQQYVWASILAVSLVLVTFFLKHLNLPSVAKLALPLIPIGAGTQYMRVLIRDTQGQADELQLRIQLEAAVVIVCGLFIFILVYPLLQLAGWVGQLDYTVVLGVMVVLGIVGYIAAARRYR